MFGQALIKRFQTVETNFVFSLVKKNADNVSIFNTSGTEKTDNVVVSVSEALDTAATRDT